MSNVATRRIQKELNELMGTPLENIQIVPDEQDMKLWQIYMTGPAKTPYAGGRFNLQAEFTLEFPFKPPQLKFKTKMYHPNIDSDGNLCLGILKTDQWKPSTKMAHVLMSIYGLLVEPNPDDPLVSSIADQYRQNPKEFEKKASEYVAKYAS